MSKAIKEKLNTTFKKPLVFDFEEIDKGNFTGRIEGLLFTNGLIKNSKFSQLGMCNFFSTKFENCEFIYGDFDFCQFDSCEFTNCKFNDSEFENCSFEDAIFKNSELENARFSSTNFNNTSFNACGFFGSYFSNSRLDFAQIKDSSHLSWNCHEFMATIIWENANNYEQVIISGFIRSKTDYCWLQFLEKWPKILEPQKPWLLDLFYRLAKDTPGQKIPYHLERIFRENNYDLSPLEIE